MKLHDINKLLDEGKNSEALDNILEELGDAAAEPVATEDKPAEEVKPEIENKDVYNAETEPVAVETVKEVVVEELGDAAAEPVATEDKPAEEVKPEVAAEKVEDSVEAEHVAEGEAPAEVVVEELGEVAAEPVATEDREAKAETPEIENKDIYNAETEPAAAEEVKEVVVEDTLEVSPEALDAAEAGHDNGVEEPIGELEPEDDVNEVPAPDEVIADTEETMEAEDAVITESMKSIFAVLKNLKEELGDAAAEPVATEDKPAEEACPVETGVEVEKSLESDHAAEGEAPAEVVVEELGDAAAEPVATEEGEGKAETPEIENKDIYNAETEPVAAEEVKEVVVEEQNQKYKTSENGKSKGNDVKYKYYEDKIDPAKPLRRVERTETNAAGKVVKYSDKPNSGNSDRFYGGVKTESVSVEALVNVITEAAKRCKAKGAKITNKNICEEAEADVKALMGVGEEPADKEYDVDAAIESAEMNGSEEKFEKYEDIQGEGADAALTGLKETVKYGSIKEAYLLDEDYFANSTYSIQTADEKTEKLTEQLALMIARDSMDPLYDNLLKEAVYTQRLHEACVNKYKAAAAKKAKQIIEKK